VPGHLNKQQSRPQAASIREELVEHRPDKLLTQKRSMTDNMKTASKK
jgi:hypothetical protein